MCTVKASFDSYIYITPLPGRFWLLKCDVMCCYIVVFIYMYKILNRWLLVTNELDSGWMMEEYKSCEGIL